MNITIRRAGPADEAVCARLVYDAFKDVSERHGFTSGFATVEVARRVVRVFLGLDAMWSAPLRWTAASWAASFTTKGTRFTAWLSSASIPGRSVAVSGVG